MKYLLVLVIFIAGAFMARAQSKTTNDLHKKYDDAWTLFFYNNTLRMLNQSGDPEFDQLIKDIEKMKFLMVDKTKNKFGSVEFKKLVSSYKNESFEEAMTSRYEGRNFDVYLKEKKGSTEGMVVLVNDSTNLYVLDILGRIDLKNITKLYKTLDENEISKRLQSVKKVKDEIDKNKPE